MIDRRLFRNSAVLLMLVMLLVGCSDDVVDEPVALPEVNDENCQQDNIMKIKDKALRSQFASLCIRRGGLVHSTPQSW